MHASRPAAAASTGSRPRVRLPHDPRTRAHRLPSSHRILGPGLDRESPRYRLPFPRMPSGKRARQQRQQAAAHAAPPPVRSKGGGGTRARQASPRALAIAGGVVLIVVDRRRARRRPQRRQRQRQRRIVTTSDMQGLPTTGSAELGRRAAGSARRERPLQGHPAERPHSRQPEGARHDGDVHRRPVPRLPGLRDVNICPRSSRSTSRAGRCSCTSSPGPSSARSRSPAGTA